MKALTARGLKVSPAKVGPDYIDPGYHALACGRAGVNLDEWICGRQSLLQSAGARFTGTDGADVMVVEGVMGMFDGAAEASGPGNNDPALLGDYDPRCSLGSTASVARSLRSPVVLVVDSRSLSSSAGAVVMGFSRFNPEINIAGIVLNGVASPNHDSELRASISSLGRSAPPILGSLPRDPSLSWRDRHLGLVPVAERLPSAVDSLEMLGAAVEAHLDVDGILAVARRAETLRVATPPRPQFCGSPTVAVASGKAFTFAYSENLEILAQAGATIAPFDPLTDEALPHGTDGLYLGGGFPEIYAPKLSSNTPLMRQIRAAFNEGMPTWAECAGMMYLSSSVDGHPMCDLIPAECTMSPTLTLGYRRAISMTENVLGPAGAVMWGHEFHYSRSSPPGSSLELSGRQGTTSGGFAGANFLASYLHVLLPGSLQLAERFVSACACR